MPNLRIPKRLSAAVLKCGKNRVFMDPARTEQLATATSRHSIRRLVKQKIILKRPIRGHSRYRCRLYREAKRAGRHMGLGKRKGTANARTPRKQLWMDKIRVLRRLLKKFREQKKIDKTTYHKFYQRSKGNQFKNKKHLMESIWDDRNQQNKEKSLLEQSEARKAKAAAKREKKAAAAAGGTAAAVAAKK